MFPGRKMEELNARFLYRLVRAHPVRRPNAPPLSPRPRLTTSRRKSPCTNLQQHLSMRSRYDHCSTESHEQNMRPKSRNQHVGFFAAIAVTMAVQTRVLDERLAAMFVRELQRAVARDDRAAVSALIQYPVTVFAGGLRIPIPDAAALLQSYDVIFSPALKAVIARAAIPARGRAGRGTSVAMTTDRAIAASIVSVNNRAPVDSHANDGVRTWIGRVPADGDYRIDVVRLASGGDPRLPYVLVVSMQ